MPCLNIVKDTAGGYKVNFRIAILATFSVFLIISGLHLYYNKINFGTYFKFTNTLPRYQIVNLAQLQGTDVVAGTAPNSGSGTVFQETNLPRGIFELTVAPDKGLLVFSPILLLAFLGMYFALQKSASLEAGTIFSLVLVDLFTYASFGDPWGGWAFGPRYLIPAMFGCAIFVGMALSELRNKLWPKLLTFVLFSYSAAVALLGALTTNAVPPKVEAVYII